MLSELLTEIQKYVSQKSSISDLQAWLVANLQGILGSGDQTAIRIANQLDVDLIHLTDGVVSEQDVWERLVDVLREHDPFALPEDIVVVAKTSSESVDVNGALTGDSLQVVYLPT